MPMRASTVLGVNELRKRSKTVIPALNADSDATVDISIANKSLAVSDKTL